MKHIMNYEPVDIILRGDHELPHFFDQRLDDIIGRMTKHEPIQYILQSALFHGHEFKVTQSTLIPRPETEQLVDIIIDENPASDLAVLDIGTGSGCIAVSLAMAMRFPVVTAIDISQQALEVAQHNARKIKAQVNFVQADALHLTALPCEPLDIIVSNPPYVCYNEQDSMEPNVLNYEPHTALFVPDNDPLVFYRAIARYASQALKRGGRIYLEINRQFGKETAQLLASAGFSDINVRLDSFGNTRFVSAVWA